MRLLLISTALLALAVSTAAADVYAVKGRDGVVTLTNRASAKKKGRLFYRNKRAARRPPKRSTKRSRASSRKTGGSGRYGRRESAAVFVEQVRGAAEHYGLPEALIWAVMKVESDFNPRAVSRVGAQGLMQLMPPTAADMGVSDAFDPSQNIYGGSRYLRLLANRFDGDLVLTLSGYHAGGGAVNSAGGIPYEQTAEYVRRVLNAYYAYQKAPPA